jgi:hypothetical protein
VMGGRRGRYQKQTTNGHCDTGFCRHEFILQFLQRAGGLPNMLTVSV